MTLNPFIESCYVPGALLTPFCAIQLQIDATVTTTVGNDITADVIGHSPCARSQARG